MSPSVRASFEWLLANISSSPLLSRLTGWLCDLKLPRPLLERLVQSYVRLYRVDLSEAVAPQGGYPSFNEFFTRRLAEGRRPIARELNAVVSPCDSLLCGIGPLPPSGRLEQVKGCDYTIEALLASREEAAPFRQGGCYATLYLSPAMYHRVHVPAAGRIASWRYVPGRLFPVNGAGVRSIHGLFTKNERVAVLLDTDAHGPIAVVLVGAANVGRISLSFAELVTHRGAKGGRFTPEKAAPVAAGDELGVFNLGSTVVLLVADRSLVPVSTAGQTVRMGEALWLRSR